jgi:hypothetical protein
MLRERARRAATEIRRILYTDFVRKRNPRFRCNRVLLVKYVVDELGKLALPRGTFSGPCTVRRFMMALKRKVDD